MHEAPEIEFRVMSRKVARLKVTRADGSFGLMTDSRTQVHQLGYRNGPLYRLTQPYSPDDAWTVDSILSGKCIQDPGEVGHEQEQPWSQWLDGSLATRGHGLLQALPQGEYLLVRTSRPRHRLERVLLGNELVPATPNIVGLREKKPVYSCVIGPRRNEEPQVNHTLIGLTILNYTGSSRMQGMLFFSFEDSRRDNSGSTGTEVVLSIPMDGELVVDNMGFFSRSEEVESRRRWRDELVLQFGDWCAGLDPWNEGTGS
ncbi:hypothetical protein [Cystobacter ferrugineus]|uniref:Uncharacterized protein n=1 Tax=Cystobacter ferrugineus TaxID=83449 RepID=A0A1L9AVA9_9BACT|nr:hypothetical protein [Cystobacter ferrugineus]OJH33947.1 hypothetical protein BON30_46335 [Cystobacter ferrugineus]